MAMKKFFVKCFIMFLIVFSALFVINYWYTNTNYLKSRIKPIEKFYSVPEHIQLANLGSSHGADDFDYSNMPYRAYNLGLSSQLYLFDYAVLKQYINHFDKGSVCIILVEYFEITGIKTDFSDLIMRYYRFLDKDNMPEYSIIDYIQYARFPVLTLGNNILSGGLNFMVMAEDEQEKSAEFTNIDELKKICEERYTYLRGYDSSSFVHESGDAGFAYNQKLLSDIIELCLANDIQPVLVSTPIISILNKIYAEKSPGFFDTFYRFSREICKKYPGLLYFDYSHDGRFSNDYSLFMNGDHLNKAGAKKFTSVVVADLINAGLLK